MKQILNEIIIPIFKVIAVFAFLAVIFTLYLAVNGYISNYDYYIVRLGHSESEYISFRFFSKLGGYNFLLGLVMFFPILKYKNIKEKVSKYKLFKTKYKILKTILLLILLSIIGCIGYSYMYSSLSEIPQNKQLYYVLFILFHNIPSVCLTIYLIDFIKFLKKSI